MDAHLFNLPVLATICRASDVGRCVAWVPGAVGHFPVYFTSSKNGVFAVDKEKNDEVDKRAEAPVDGLTSLDLRWINSSRRADGFASTRKVGARHELGWRVRSEEQKSGSDAAATIWWHEVSRMVV